MKRPKDPTDLGLIQVWQVGGPPGHTCSHKRDLLECFHPWSSWFHPPGSPSSPCTMRILFPKVILNLNEVVSIVSSAVIALGYTLFGGLISVAYTDVIQIFFIVFGLFLALPFALTNEHVKNIYEETLDDGVTPAWYGKVGKGPTLKGLFTIFCLSFKSHILDSNGVWYS